MKRNEVKVPFKRDPAAVDLDLPRYVTAGAAGMDLTAAVDQPVIIKPQEILIIPTGISVAVPVGYELQIRPRSGLAARSGIGVLNSPGTIDSDYRGEIKVILINLGKEPFTVNRNERVAQMVLCPVVFACLEEVNELPSTERGDGGFGHSGVSGKDSQS